MLARKSSAIFLELIEQVGKSLTQSIDRIKKIRLEHADDVIGKINVSSVFGGMRGLPLMLTETSSVDMNTGVRYRGSPLDKCANELPGCNGVPSTEGVLWLLLTGTYPTEKQTSDLSKELETRAKSMPEIEIDFVKSLPVDMHPMTQLSMSILHQQRYSTFAESYGKVPKLAYWQFALEDCMTLISYLPRIAALIYHRTCLKSEQIPVYPDNMDWANSYAHMLGCSESKDFYNLVKLYLFLHVDHEGGNVSSHLSHLAGSALADPFLAFSSALNGLAGPLHGLANQESLKWLLSISQAVGDTPTQEKVKELASKALASGTVIPGYGHAALRNIDPRFTLLMEFGKSTMPNDRLYKLATCVYEVVPDLLKATGKVSNPYPNVDAASGVCMHHFGLTQFNYYTVIFAVARAIGTCSQYVLARGQFQPIERPRSVTLDKLENLIEKAQESKL